jgi:hypothetical protein
MVFAEFRQTRMRKKILQNLLFTMILIVVSFLFNQPKYLDYPPRGSHQWRQSDAYSMTLNYYNGGMKFFEPAIHLYQSDEGKAVGEFPIIYYFDALLWKITGPSHVVVRFVNLFIAFCGLFALFRLLSEVLKDPFYAIIIPVFIASSPLFGFYSSSYLINIDALSFLFISWWFFYRFYQEKKMLWLGLALLFVTLAGLLRSTMLLGYFPIMAFYFYQWWSNNRIKSGRGIAIAVLFMAPIIFNLLWINFASNYNKTHHSDYFLTTIRPFWEASNPAKTWSKYYFESLSELFSSFFKILFPLLLLVIIFNLKKYRNVWVFFTLIIALELMVYTALWFQNLDVHDYYLIEYLIIIPPILIATLIYMKAHLEPILKSVKFRAIVLIVLIFSLFYGIARTRIRYDKKAFFFTHLFLSEIEIHDWGTFHWYYDRSLKSFETIDPYLDSIGIKQTDLVVSVPDPSSNISLSLMDRKGYSMLYMNKKALIDSLPSYIDRGAKYLFIYDHTDFDTGYLNDFTQNKIGEYQNIQIFKLK